MKNDEIRQSEELAKHFAPYSDETPMLSPNEIDNLLAKHDMLPNHPPTTSLNSRGSLLNVRRIIMTLSGITGLALIAYFAFFNSASIRTSDSIAINGTNGSHTTHTSHGIPEENKIAQPATTETNAAKTTPNHLSKSSEHGPWSAGNDQIYADLSKEELARIGIVAEGDTVFSYKLNGKDSVECTKLSQFSISGIKFKGHSIGGSGILPAAPRGVQAPRFYPVLMTFSNGNGAAYRIEDMKTHEIGIISESDMEKDFRAWLEKPETPGYHALGFNTSSQTGNDHIEHDTVKIQIGKNFPQPPLFPFFAPRNFSDSIKQALTQLAHYSDGSSEIKTTVAWPKTLTVIVDTITPKYMLAKMDSEENSSTMQHLHSIMARLNELVPVVVRHNAGSGAPDSNDFIFWYEPSEELFSALPKAQAEAFRAKLAEPPHCLNAPNAVLTTAEITYCVDRPQKVKFIVNDLTGRERLSSFDEAVAGDNVWDFITATLPSGMYLVTVRNEDSSERTRRIWVENAHPKTEAEYYDDLINSALKNGVGASVQSDSSFSKSSIGLPAIKMLDLPDNVLARLGIESDEWVARFYEHTPWNSAKILEITIERKGGSQIQNVDSTWTRETVPDFRPQFITDGTGGKRIATSASAISLFDDKGYDDINNLIPIILRKDGSTDSITSSDLIFWYKPTPEFLALLPDSSRAIVQKITNGTINDHLATIAVIHGAISKAIVFPNPSNGKFSVDLTMGEARNLTFTLRNLLGQQVASPVQAHSDGESNQALDFSQAAEGVYLLDITSDAGERNIQRIVIAR